MGKLSDSEGAAIDRAHIELFRKSDNRVPAATAAPDKTGLFSIKDVPPGSYQLRVSSTGFTPSLVPVTVAPGTSLDRSIEVQLNVLGSACTGAKVDKAKSRDH